MSFRINRSAGLSLRCGRCTIARAYDKGRKSREKNTESHKPKLRDFIAPNEYIRLHTRASKKKYQEAKIYTIAAYRRVLTFSSRCMSRGDRQAIISVKLLPPRACFKSVVNLDSRYGIWASALT